MARYKTLFATILTSSVLTLSTAAIAQSEEDSCGVAPSAPSILDGASSTMDQLVENSKAVNGFIADADTYLDCREALVKDRTNGLSKDVREMISKSISSLTDQRNQIGDDFNTQVAAFKEANPG